MKQKILPVVIIIMCASYVKAQPAIDYNFQGQGKYVIWFPSSYKPPVNEPVPGSINNHTPRATMVFETGNGNFRVGNAVASNCDFNGSYCFLTNGALIYNVPSFAVVTNRYDTARPREVARIFSDGSSSLPPAIEADSTILDNSQQVIKVLPYVNNVVDGQYSHFVVSAKNQKGVIAFLYNYEDGVVFDSLQNANETFSVSNIVLKLVRVHQGQSVFISVNNARNIFQTQDRRNLFNNAIQDYLQGHYKHAIFINNNASGNSNRNYFITLKPSGNPYIATDPGFTKVKAVFIPLESGNASTPSIASMDFSATAFDPNYIVANIGCVTNPNQQNVRMHITIHFENTGNAAATNITIYDTLSSHFDFGSVILQSIKGKIGGTEYSCNKRIGNEIDTTFTASKDPVKPILTIKFKNIKLPGRPQTIYPSDRMGTIEFDVVLKSLWEYPITQTAIFQPPIKNKQPVSGNKNNKPIKGVAVAHVPQKRIGQASMKVGIKFDNTLTVNTSRGIRLCNSVIAPNTN